MLKSFFRIILSGVFLLFVLFLFYVSVLFFIRPKTEFRQIQVGQSAITVQWAKTPLEKSRGLSRQESLGPGQGMLFAYDQYVIPGFWMKEMNFPIDIIWIRDDQIVGFSENLPPEGFEPENIYKPSSPVNYVLEVPAGFVQQEGLKTGDRVIIK